MSAETVRAAYLWARRGPDAGAIPMDAILADALRDAEARAMKLEFEQANHCITAERHGDGVRAYRTNYDDNDPRHKYTPADWKRAADKRLRGENE